ncbi:MULTISPECIES: hypothetical protein [unclassified Endozoicomonas]|uniref:hypothetical protein n=1 Tax=unclassified Endozoicomonas TaxID=2644528 RepID=UPI0021494BF8|nr:MULTISPECIES: hypothetical protein [unclassified Endozoicomonas]
MDDSRKNETETQSSTHSCHNEARLLALRKAYLAGELRVDSARVADKLLAFESTLESALRHRAHLNEKSS